METTEPGWRRALNWLRDSALAVVAVLLVLAVATSGWSASFISLHNFAVEHMSLGSGPAWLVPGTFDGAALGLSLLAFRAATFGRASFGARLYVYGFTALSSWINYIHITDRQGRIVACLLPIAAVIVFDKVLREAREAYERRHGKQVFRIRPGLLLLRLAIDGRGTRAAIRTQIAAIPVEALIGLGAGDLARAATPALPSATPVKVTPAIEAAPPAEQATPEVSEVELEQETEAEPKATEAGNPPKWVDPQEARYKEAVRLNRMSIAAMGRPIGAPALRVKLRDLGYAIGTKGSSDLAKQFRAAWDQAMNAPDMPAPEVHTPDGEGAEKAEVPAEINGHDLVNA